MSAGAAVGAAVANDAETADPEAAGAAVANDPEAAVPPRQGAASREATSRGEQPPLDGFLVGITADRRKDELADLLQRRGARTLTGTAIRIVPLADDQGLLGATKALIAEPPSHVVATTGIGFRGWLEVADGWGLADELRDRLAGARVIARGPKAKGAIRAAGLTESWSPPSESSTEVLEHLLESDLTGARVAVQLHGEPLPFLVDGLRAAGADVVEVPVYRWVTPPDTTGFDRLVRAVADAAVDAVTFTSAPAAVATLARAAELGVETAVLERLRDGTVVACCVGPVTAGPREQAGVRTVQPDRSRLGAMVRELCARLPERARKPLPVAGRRLALRATGAMVDGQFVDVTSAQRSLLGVLAERPGVVRTRSELAAAMPGDGGERAVEMGITRLRGTLGDSRFVQTVVKRGYRLAYEPAATGDAGSCEPHT